MGFFKDWMDKLFGSQHDSFANSRQSMGGLEWKRLNLNQEGADYGPTLPP